MMFNFDLYTVPLIKIAIHFNVRSQRNEHCECFNMAGVRSFHF